MKEAMALNFQQTLAACIQMFSESDFQIVYKIGAANKEADAISRVSGDMNVHNNSGALMLLSRPIPKFIETLKHENELKKDMRSMQARVHEGKAPKAFTVVEGVLMYNGRFVISQDSDLKEELLQEFHDTLAVGHVGVKRLW